MTNAEKYKEVFGFEPDMENCPTLKCLECPCHKKNDGVVVCGGDSRAWWVDDYKGGAE